MKYVFDSIQTIQSHPFLFSVTYLEEAGIAAICEKDITHNIPEDSRLWRCEVNHNCRGGHHIGVSELVAKAEVDIVTPPML